MQPRHQRILHVDGDSFFASCEIALDKSLGKRPVFVGGGRRGDGIVIAANYIAKRYGIITGMACFEAKRKCPEGVLVRPHYDEYRRLSVEMFRRVRHYTPLLVPTSIDEGFMDFTDSPAVFRCRNAAELATRIKREIAGELSLPVSMGLGSSRWLAKLATDHCKPDGFQEVPEDHEREFLRDVPVQKLAGIATRRARSLRALGVWTFGDVAQLLDDVRDDSKRVVDFILRGPSTQRKHEGAFRLFIGEAHRFQHMRRAHRFRVARRAQARGDAGLIQPEDERLAAEAIDADVQVVRQPRCP